jgi:hypothetical protein
MAISAVIQAYGGHMHIRQFSKIACVFSTVMGYFQQLLIHICRNGIHTR